MTVFLEVDLDAAAAKCGFAYIANLGLGRDEGSVWREDRRHSSVRPFPFMPTSFSALMLSL
jgi:hypothetical protein